MTLTKEIQKYEGTRDPEYWEMSVCMAGDTGSVGAGRCVHGWGTLGFCVLQSVSMGWDPRYVGVGRCVHSWGHI